MSDFSPRFLADYAVPTFNIETVDLVFDLDDTKTKVISTLVMTRQGIHKEALILNGEHLTLLSISIDEEILSPNDYQLSETTLALNVEQERFTLKIITEIDPLNNTALEGLFMSGGAFCTQCEAEGFRRITYYLDRPDVMAVFTTKVIADKYKFPFLLANGNSVAKGEETNNRHFVKWHDPFPKPCYLFALVAGDFDLLEDTYQTSEGRDVKLEIFVDRGNLHKAHHAMSSLKRSMQWDEETFGLAYDLDIYMIVAVDFFNMGAMENKGLNVFNSKFVLADETSATDTDYFNIEAVIAHEYFHNWTGNRITCRDWFQLSLKEGLTVFRDQQFSADMHSAAVNRIKNVKVLRSAQFAEDASPMSHPIRPEKVVEMNNFYTLTVYEKGSEVIRMMHTLLGKDNFRKGMDLYFDRYDGMAVTCDDFVNAMSDASGADLTLFSAWYRQSGTPTLTVTESFDGKSGEFNIEVSQHIEGRADAEVLHIPIAIELLDNNKTQSHLLELTTSSNKWTFTGLSNKPSVAFLGNFTAPVKVNYAQSDAALEKIITQAKDEFCAWDAGQKLYTNYIKALVNEPDFSLPQSLSSIFIRIANSNIDAALKAEQLSIPSFDELLDSFAQVDPILLLNAMHKLKVFLAGTTKEVIAETYQNNIQESYLNDGEAVGKRALANVCLGYIALSKDLEAVIEDHFDNSTNMTDTLAALQCSARNNLSAYQEQMQRFETKWEDTTLVMDKWFTIAATISSEDVYQQLDTLLAHSLFTLTNPNRARSLIGAFTMMNPRYFHCVSGRGYKFLTDQLIELNTINPQVASRLITPLIQFKRFDLERQKLMKQQLERLNKIDNLSNDLKEKLELALT